METMDKTNRKAGSSFFISSFKPGENKKNSEPIAQNKRAVETAPFV